MKFEIYDGSNDNLLTINRTEIDANNARQALQKYLDDKNMGHLKFCNTSNNDVIWKTTPFYEKDEG